MAAVSAAGYLHSSIHAMERTSSDVSKISKSERYELFMKKFNELATNINALDKAINSDGKPKPTELKSVYERMLTNGLIKDFVIEIPSTTNIVNVPYPQTIAFFKGVEEFIETIRFSVKLNCSAEVAGKIVEKSERPTAYSFIDLQGKKLTLISYDHNCIISKEESSPSDPNGPIISQQYDAQNGINTQVEGSRTWVERLALKATSLILENERRLLSSFHSLTRVEDQQPAASQSSGTTSAVHAPAQ